MVLCPDITHRPNPKFGVREWGAYLPHNKRGLEFPFSDDTQEDSRSEICSEIPGLSKAQDRWSNIGCREYRSTQRLRRLTEMLQPIEGSLSNHTFLLPTRHRDSSPQPTRTDGQDQADNVSLSTFLGNLVKTIEAGCKTSTLLCWYSINSTGNWPQAWGKVL